MIIGIDLGTTNSAVGVWRDGAVTLIPNSLGQVLTPSAVSIDEAGQVLVGLLARERQSTHPDRTASAFKRYMGSRRETRLGDKVYLPEELSALVLRNLKADAEAFLGEPVTEAVITVPAYFSDKQRKATRRAGELAGLKVERLLNEPTAAALAYGMNERGAEAKFLVFDLGGGTFDVSILELFEGVIEVRASAGDNQLGGEDFNEILVEMFKSEFAGKFGRADLQDERLYQRLRHAAELCRRRLTEEGAAQMSVIWRDLRYDLEVGAEDYEAKVEPLLVRLREPVLRSLRDSDLRADMLDEIVLVGGATRMPIVRKSVTKMFGRFPAATINPDEAVARGAAIQAALKARDAALNEVVLTDVCPYTLGVDVAETGPNNVLRGGIFAPIIERNTTIPASRIKRFYNIRDNQPVVDIGIYQGEARRVMDNVQLGQITIPIPRGPANSIEIDCRFTYDINGLLEVDLKVPATGEMRQLVIMEDGGMSAEEVEARRAALAHLKVHPRDEDLNRSVMARAERCFESFTGEVRAFIGQLMTQFEVILEGQDPRAIAQAREQITERLDEIEGRIYL